MLYALIQQKCIFDEKKTEYIFKEVLIMPSKLQINQILAHLRMFYLQ